MHVEIDGLQPRLAFLLRGDLAIPLHQIEHQVAPLQSAVWIHDRRIGWTTNERGKQRGFGQSQLGHGPAKIKLRGGLKSVIAMRQIDLIGIHGEDLLLGIVAFDLDRQKGFLNLSAKAAVRTV